MRGTVHPSVSQSRFRQIVTGASRIALNPFETLGGWHVEAAPEIVRTRKTGKEEKEAAPFQETQFACRVEAPPLSMICSTKTTSLQVGSVFRISVFYGSSSSCSSAVAVYCMYMLFSFHIHVNYS